MGWNDFKKDEKKDGPNAPVVDRLPPHSIEAEQGVLGCVLLSAQVIAECISNIPAGEESFYDLRHRTMYHTMVEMFKAAEPIDVITLCQKLKDNGAMESVGGLAYISTLPDAVPSAANLDYYINILIEKYRLRRTLQMTTDISAKIYNAGKPADEIMDEVEHSLMEVAKLRVSVSSRTMRDLIAKNINTIERYHNNPGVLMGLPSGLVDLDKVLCGFENGTLNYIGARPSTGKTSLLLNIADHLAVNLKLPGAVFSLEMKDEQLTMRMLSARARVNIRNIQDGFLAERDFPRLSGAAGKLTDAPIYIDDASGITILQLRSKARLLFQQYGIKWIGVDYFQLLSSPRRRENRQQELADVSAGLKSLAKDLDIPVIVLAQLDRSHEKDNRKPRMSDIRECGAAEQDGDTIVLLSKKIKKKKDEDEADDDRECDVMEVLADVAKARSGSTKEVNLLFVKSITKFECPIPEQAVMPTEQEMDML